MLIEQMIRSDARFSGSEFVASGLLKKYQRRATISSKKAGLPAYVPSPPIFRSVTGKK